MDQTVSYFINGLRYWIDENFDAARETFEYCAEDLDGSQCDLYRALAHLNDRLKGKPSPELIEKIYQTLPTWGRLLTAVGTETGTVYPSDYFPISIDLGYLEVTYDSYTRTGIHIARSAILADQGHFDAALEVINAAPVKTPVVQLATVLIYFKASRWQDVIDQAQDLVNPMRYDGHDKPLGQPDPFLQAIVYLLTGISYAHLGNFVTATERLITADTKQVGADGGEFHYAGVGAEACYYLGLIERAKGEEDNARVAWNSGLAYLRTEKLTEALADPNVRLRQTTAQLINQRTAYWDARTEPDLNEVRQAERAENQSSILAEAEDELTKQIGMEEVKAQVRRLKSAAAYEQEKARRGKVTERQAMHLIFAGPPGTGKTTIARVIAKIFAGIGVCPNDTVVEASRGDLVGNHEGDSIAMTRAVIEKADGGVLFIDEAYEIVQARNSGQVDPFGTEAMTELMREMENRRDTLIVIMAGYEGDMNRLLATNDGLVSRFPRRITFHSYMPEEIAAIAVRVAEDRHNILAEESRRLFVDAAQRLQATNAAGKKMLDVAGNGRFVRNVIELAEEFRSERLGDTNLRALSDEELDLLAREDVEQAMRKELAKHNLSDQLVEAPTIMQAAPAAEEWPSYNGGSVN
ncbi:MULTISPECIES: AAA family ATPase [Mycolicibacter]|uniref:AAA family ATPase n=2 Tax=Mycolicibacter TaxID=1073531 RepID=A0ABU5XKX0_9MYCO|nr:MULTISPECIES: AAA family ATPase [unclassified Mycolicibacter]MEB3022940.1 AAA family ATPase [Mycolicibacter sp. MYC098]MEB3035073.1 AAA family ATPase [Mycolicibacter sp. MYC340]